MPIKKNLSVLDVLDSIGSFTSAPYLEAFCQQEIENGNFDTLADPAVRHGFELGAHLITAKILSDLQKKSANNP